MKPVLFLSAARDWLSVLPLAGRVLAMRQKLIVSVGEELDGGPKDEWMEVLHHVNFNNQPGRELHEYYSREILAPLWRAARLAQDVEFVCYLHSDFPMTSDLVKQAQDLLEQSQETKVVGVFQVVHERNASAYESRSDRFWMLRAGAEVEMMREIHEEPPALPNFLGLFRRLRELYGDQQSYIEITRNP